jgi:hypothetical protein
MFISFFIESGTFALSHIGLVGTIVVMPELVSLPLGVCLHQPQVEATDRDNNSDFYKPFHHLTPHDYRTRLPGKKERSVLWWRLRLQMSTGRRYRKD